MRGAARDTQAVGAVSAYCLVRIRYRLGPANWVGRTPDPSQERVPAGRTGQPHPLGNAKPRSRCLAFSKVSGRALLGWKHRALPPKRALSFSRLASCVFPATPSPPGGGAGTATGGRGGPSIRASRVLLTPVPSRWTFRSLLPAPRSRPLIQTRDPLLVGLEEDAVELRGEAVGHAGQEIHHHLDAPHGIGCCIEFLARDLGKEPRRLGAGL